MIVFPAIDILDGQSVRLTYGDFHKVTVYGDPVEMAEKWCKQGAQYLHVVDLNGAAQGRRHNADAIREIVRHVQVPVQLGGGIRTQEDIDYCLSEIGVQRVILGTVCCSNPQLLKEAVQRFGAEQIVCGIDARNGKVSVDGWTKESTQEPIALALKMQKIGIKYVVYTDISRDGALTGINIEACKEMMQATDLQIIASGGLSSLTEIEALCKENMYGAILGKAIYENKFSVTDAIQTTQGERV